MEASYYMIILYLYTCQDEDIDNTLLNENDLVAILQQFPFTQVFKHILHVSDSGKSTLRSLSIYCMSVIAVSQHSGL